ESTQRSVKCARLRSAKCGHAILNQSSRRFIRKDIERIAHYIPRCKRRYGRKRGLYARVQLPSKISHFAFERGRKARAYERDCTLNAKTVRDRYSLPGRNMVDGNCGWLGESGKC